MASKKMTKKEIIDRVKGSALLTTKKHETRINASLNMGFSEQAFSAFLKTVLPADHSFTVAANTTGKGFTCKVFNAIGETVDRVFFPSHKVKYEGFGFGKPMLKNLASILNMPEAELCQVRQGKKEYWYNDNMGLLQTYFETKFKKPE